MPTQTIQILEWQAAFLACTDRVAGVIGGLGSGKSYIACHWLIDRVMKYPKGTHRIAGRDLTQLKNGAIPTLCDVLDKRGIAWRLNKTDSSIAIETSEGECVVKMISIENYKSLRSLEADSIWADELSEFGLTDEPFVKYLYPRLRPSPGGKCYPDLSPQMRFTTNPVMSISHWLYDLLEVKQFCKYWQASTRDNWILLRDDPEYLTTLLKSMHPDEAEVLIDGQWGNITTGRVYKWFNRRTMAKVPDGMPPLVINPRKPLQWALDFNVGLMCSVISQTYTQESILDSEKYNRLRFMGATVEELAKMRKPKFPEYQDRVVYIVGQLRLPDCGVPDVLDAFFEKYGVIARQCGVRIYGDPAGGGRSQQLSAKSSARSNWALIAERFRKTGTPHEMRIMGQAPAILDRVNAVNSQFMSADKRIGMVIDLKEAKDVAVDLEQTRWKEGTNDLDKSEPTVTHLTDALGYQIYPERVLAKTARVRKLRRRWR